MSFNYNVNFKPDRPSRIVFSFSKEGYDPSSEGVGSSGTWTHEQDGTWAWETEELDLCDSFYEAFQDEDNDVVVVSAELYGYRTGDYDEWYGLFAYCTSIKAVGDVYFYGDQLNLLFEGCKYITSIGVITAPNATEARYTFDDCYALTAYPVMEIPSVVNVEGMYCGMKIDHINPVLDMDRILIADYLYSWSGLTSIPDITWNNVTSMDGAFRRCTGLTQVGIITANHCESTYQLLEGNSALVYLDNPIYLPESTTLSNMFANCSVFKGYRYLYAPKAFNLSYMFAWCPELETCPPITAEHLRYTHGMFTCCRKLTQAPNLDVSACVFVQYMFNLCTSLTAAPAYDLSSATTVDGFLSGSESEPMSVAGVARYDLKSATSAYKMFSYCDKLTSVIISSCEKLAYGYGMFMNCKSAYIGISQSSGALTNMYAMFQNCYSMSESPEINTSNVTTMNSAFWNCRKIKALYPYNMKNVKDASHMLGGYAHDGEESGAGVMSLETLPDLDLSSCTGTRAMFQNCEKLKSVRLLHSGSVTSASWMFNNCIALESLSMDTMHLSETTHRMFARCLKLSTIPSMDTKNVSDLYEMYYFCQQITGMPGIDVTSATDVTGVLDGCENISSGIKAMYDKMAARNPASHSRAFKNCGINSSSGSAELAQIPDGWKT